MKTRAFDKTQDWAAVVGKNHAMPESLPTEHLIYEAATVLAAGSEGLEDLKRMCHALQLCVVLQHRDRMGQLNRRQRQVADQLFLLCSEVSELRATVRS